MSLKRLAYCSLVFVAVLLASCRKNCYEPQKSLMGITFRDSLTRQSITLASLTVKAVDSDSILYKKVSASSVYLPLHINKDVTEYRFTAAPFTSESDSVKFNVTVQHISAPQFLSPECGCIPYYQIQTVNVVSETRCVRSSELIEEYVINTEGESHVQIFF